VSIPTLIHPRIPNRFPHSLGFSKRCLRFNGANYVDLGTINVGTEGTIAFFAETSVWNPDVIRGLVGNGLSHTQDNCIIIAVHSLDTINLMFRFGSDAQGGGYISYPESRFWYGCHYIAVTWEVSNGNTIIRLYADGFLRDSRTLATSFSATITELGSTRGQTDYWLDLIDEFTVYSRRLTQAEIVRNMLEYHNPDRTGLICWLRMDEGVGLTAYDWSGSGNHGSLMPAADPPVWANVKKWELRK